MFFNGCSKDKKIKKFLKYFCLLNIVVVEKREYRFPQHVQNLGITCRFSLLFPSLPVENYFVI